jgi:hypothetical protein
MGKSYITPQASDLLEHDSRLIESLTEGFINKGRVFVIPDELLRAPLSKNAIEEIARLVCMWLGVKPHDLNVRIVGASNQVGYEHSDAGHFICLPKRLTSDPHHAAALLVRSCVEYFLKKSGGVVAGSTKHYNRLIDKATIILGLGIPILNSAPIYPPHSVGNAVHKFRLAAGRYTHTPAILHHSVHDYADELYYYLLQHGIDMRIAEQYLESWSSRYMASSRLMVLLEETTVERTD